MNDIAIISYGGALILLYLCILLYSQACKSQNSIFAKLITLFGMVPGFIGVIYGFILILSTGKTGEGVAIMTAWLLLELGALQLKQLIQNERNKAKQEN